MGQFPFANKALGQHFLINKRTIEKITRDFHEKAQAIIEIGPGPGILTESLSSWELPLHVIDKDNRFPEYLTPFVREDHIHIADALSWPLEEKFKDWNWTEKKIWLVSNLPYNISTPLLIKFLQAPSLSYMTLMFQREVADKIFPIDTRKGKMMNSLLALSQTYFDVKILAKVPPSHFSPPPKVDSVVLSFIRKEKPPLKRECFKNYESFLRKLFQFKRKQMITTLKKHYPLNTLKKVFEDSPINPSWRAESLELSQVQTLYQKLVYNKHN